MESRSALEPLTLAVPRSDTADVVRSFSGGSTAIGASPRWTSDGPAVLFTRVERDNVWKRPR